MPKEKPNTVKLAFPIQSEGVEVASLTMRRPKVKDKKTAEAGSKDPGEIEVALFANLCGVAPEAIEELDLGDYVKLQEVFTGFFA